jgi:hypothetical protein
MTYRRRFAFPLAIALSLAGAAAFDATNPNADHAATLSA